MHSKERKESTASIPSAVAALLFGDSISQGSPGWSRTTQRSPAVSASPALGRGTLLSHYGYNVTNPTTTLASELYQTVL